MTRTVPAGAYVGRVGGLAVALGIGVALFTGAGAATADSTSSSTSSTGSSTGSSEGSGSSAASGLGSTAAKTESGTQSGGTPHQTASSAVKNAAPSTSSGSLSTHLPRNGSDEQQPSSATARTDVASTETPKPAGVSSTKESDAASAAPPKSSAPVTAAGSTTVTAAPTPKAVVTASSESADATPGAEGKGDTPSTPLGDTSLSLTMLAVARRESHDATSPSGVTPVAASTTTSTTTQSSAITTARTAAAVTVAPAVPTPVVAIPQIAPLQQLQYLPIIGQVFITPLVAAINQLPVIGALLHPLLGYPVQYGLAPGTPVPRDVKVVSFDGTEIYVHFLPAAGLASGTVAPTILDGPGLGLPGSTDYQSKTDPLFGNAVVGIGTLRTAGYNVVTWDPRGEFNSGGTAEIDSPDYEARDVSAIISWVATQPEVQLDGPPQALDPRMGMVGLSYGGGIQLVTAAIDHRVDAIVPTMAWNSLNTSLYKNEALKTGWGTLLTAALLGTFARPDPRLYPAVFAGVLTGHLTEDDQELLRSRGPGDLINRITAPTMLVQGTVDTLFTLQEADANAKALLANGVPTKVVWFCGGHGACVSSIDDGSTIIDNTLNWLARYVKNDTTVDTGPQFQWVDQNGTKFSAASYPLPTGAPLVTTITSGGTLPLVPLVGGSGPQQAVFGLGPITALLGIPSASKAVNAVNVTTAPSSTTAYVVGAPQLEFSYSGVGTGSHVYAQLVDDRTGLVVGNLATPVAVTLDGQQHVARVDMEQIAQTLAPGDTLTLQIVSSTVNYQTINSFGALTISDLKLSLPTAAPGSFTVTSPVDTLST